MLPGARRLEVKGRVPLDTGSFKRVPAKFGYSFYQALAMGLAPGL